MKPKGIEIEWIYLDLDAQIRIDIGLRYHPIFVILGPCLFCKLLNHSQGNAPSEHLYHSNLSSPVIQDYLTTQEI